MRIFGTILLVCVLVAAMYAQNDWPAYAHNQAGWRYSPLTQINVGNVSKLKLAWQYGADRIGEYSTHSGNGKLPGITLLKRTSGP